MSISKVTSTTPNFLINGVVPGLSGDIVMAGGNVFWVDAYNGSDSNDGSSAMNAFASIPYAYAKLTANQNDVLFVIGGPTSYQLASSLVWAKNYTHMIGLDSGTRVASRARMFASTANTAPISFNITASGCFFKNIKFGAGSAQAASLICMQITGGRNHFDNCAISGMENATAGTAATLTAGRSLKLSGSTGENLFTNCVIGSDTIARTATNYEIEIVSGCPRNVFENCDIISYCTAGGESHAMLLIGSGGIDRWVEFNLCRFMNMSTNVGSGVVNAQTLSLSAIAGGFVLYDTCAVVGFTATQTSSSGNLYIQNSVPTFATSGLAKAS